VITQTGDDVMAAHIDAARLWKVTLYAKGLSKTFTLDTPLLGKHFETTTEEANGQWTRHYFKLISSDERTRSAIAVFDRSRVLRRKRRTKDTTP